MKRRRFSREQWTEWLAEHAASDLSIAAFCVQKGISENSFYLWRRKLSCDVQFERRSSPFVPVNVVFGCSNPILVGFVRRLFQILLGLVLQIIQACGAIHALFYFQKQLD